MVARVARPARKKTKKIINYNRNNLDNFLPTTATAVYGIPREFDAKPLVYDSKPPIYDAKPVVYDSKALV